ncbi:hypothetical protein DHEL01_v207192 [Diaporthe helianthi]|uniref:Aflatoxin regulatory protein domain-containing protein n=1 Tax=Diaporthe helianthi TaxID=158607 RepID=A0A2P5HVW9_DIAHE|nr:hypothetical protein DHEL01_v207192 [Diaporthe helianthi]
MSPEHSSDGRHFSSASPSDMDMDMDLMLDDYSAIASPLTFDISDLTSINTELGSLTNASTMSAITDYSFDITKPVDFGDTGGGNPLFPPEAPLQQQPPPISILSSDEFTLSATDSVHIGAVPSASGHLCNCHARVLEVLNQLCSLEGGSSTDSSPGEGSLQALLDANERMLDAVGNTLPCECSKDGFLLVTMSLVAFKVMARYEAAARRQMSSWFCAAQMPNRIMQSTEESIGRGSATTSHENKVQKGPLDERMAAQVVLSELYRVQRFVRGLAKQLKEMAGLEMSADSSVERLFHSSSHHGSRGTDFLMGGIFNDPALPFSAAFFCQLETDLRRRLRGLSKELADLVRTI